MKAISAKETIELNRIRAERQRERQVVVNAGQIQHLLCRTETRSRQTRFINNKPIIAIQKSESDWETIILQ